MIQPWLKIEKTMRWLATAIFHNVWLAAVGTAVLAALTGLIGAILGNFVQYSACLLADVPSCAHPPFARFQVIILGLVFVLTYFIFACVLRASEIFLHGIRVNAQGAQPVDIQCQTLILPVSQPFSDLDESIPGYSTICNERLISFQKYLEVGDASLHMLKVGERKISNWTLDDLCEPTAMLCGDHGFDLDVLSWQQALRALAASPAPDEKRVIAFEMKKIIVVSNTEGTNTFAAFFRIIIELVAKRTNADLAVIAERPVNYEDLDQLTKTLREITERESKNLTERSGARIRIDITGGTRVFGVAAALEATRSDQIIFSYVLPNKSGPKAYNADVRSWNPKV